MTITDIDKGRRVMREIKFRAWLKKEERMYDPMRLHFVPDGRLLVEVPNWLTTWEYPEDVILMQYTGLKDKNGKEIYEGDIVKGRWLSGTIAFSKSYAGWSVANGSMFERNFEDCEVIGNIYENPELLKG